MGWFTKILGTLSSTFQLGKSGPLLKNNSGIIEARNAADNAYAIVRGATPVNDNDLATKAYVAGVAGGGNWAQVQVDFGNPTGPEEDNTATATVSAAWVTSSTKFVCTVMGGTADHDLEDAVIEGVVAYVTSVTDGVSFDVTAYAPLGSWGRYYINVLGS